MQSFRSEIENPIVEKDIIELADKIQLFKEGKIDEEKFRSLRLARGVYGQRQFGVQMIRIKIPYGKVSSNQLLRICDVSEKYSKGRLHITTRQDIQIHYVSLDKTPELWAELEKSDVTIREACGNAVRNVTASETSGIDPEEPFDVTPYADAVFRYFLRNPFCQELGRKFKVSFSNTDADTALSYIHDIGFIAKTKKINAKTTRGFKVLLGGGLGSQPKLAVVAYDFLPEEKIIPYMEGVLRVFDRYGERAKRAKARLKFLLKDVGLERFHQLVAEEVKAINYENYPIKKEGFENNPDLSHIKAPEVKIKDENGYKKWLKHNVFKQKQKGLYAIGVKVRIGDFYLDEARKLATLIKDYAADELRFTLRQNILIRHVREDLLPFFFERLSQMGFADLGYESSLDITACPGTDTCNLGIASSTGIAKKLEEVLQNEYPAYATNENLVIKISGCMNSCGQHTMAHLGFQGMSTKAGEHVAPALQILMGGGTLCDGKGAISDKVIKIPSKRGPDALRLILNDYIKNSNNKKFSDYYHEKGVKYFQSFLKPLADVTNLQADDFIDWGNEEKYQKAVGVGECAGVVIDLVETLFYDSKEKLSKSIEALTEGSFADAIYHAYSAMVNTAKALLTTESVKTNTQHKIISDFDTHFITTDKIALPTDFQHYIYRIRTESPSENFAKKYLADAHTFLEKAKAYRKNDLLK